jgi:hypothetical protein
MIIKFYADDRPGQNDAHTYAHPEKLMRVVGRGGGGGGGSGAGGAGGREGDGGLGAQLSSLLFQSGGGAEEERRGTQAQVNAGA